MKPQAIFLSDNLTTINQVYPQHIKEKLPLEDKSYTKSDILANQDYFSEVKYIFSTWGMPCFGELEVRALFPSLEAIFYAAGTVQSFAKEFLSNGVKIFSAWVANAVPVAEYTLAQILLSNKGYFQLANDYSVGNIEKAHKQRSGYIGNYNCRVGIIGAGMIGKKVIELLKPFNIEVLVFDAFLSQEDIEKLGGKKVTLSELFEKCNVVSNHLANNEHTQGMLKYEHFSKLKKNATFINTGRGAQVVEDDLVRALLERPDLTAVLDVTYPEPPHQDHQFFKLSNCFLTPHIAGSQGNEVQRMAQYMLETYTAFINGEKSDFEVTAEMLKTMA